MEAPDDAGRETGWDRIGGVKAKVVGDGAGDAGRPGEGAGVRWGVRPGVRPGDGAGDGEQPRGLPGTGDRAALSGGADSGTKGAGEKGELGDSTEERGDGGFIWKTNKVRMK